MCAGGDGVGAGGVGGVAYKVVSVSINFPSYISINYWKCATRVYALAMCVCVFVCMCVHTQAQSSDDRPEGRINN